MPTFNSCVLNVSGLLSCYFYSAFSYCTWLFVSRYFANCTGRVDCMLAAVELSPLMCRKRRRCTPCCLLLLIILTVDRIMRRLQLTRFIRRLIALAKRTQDHCVGGCFIVSYWSYLHYTKFPSSFTFLPFIRLPFRVVCCCHVNGP